MTKQQFIDSVLAESNVLEVVTDSDVVHKTAGTWELGKFDVVMTTEHGGKDIRSVSYVRNVSTGDTEYQNLNSVNRNKNLNEVKIKILTDYIHSTFLGGRVTYTDLDNNYAEAVVFDTTGEKKVWIYKPDGQPLTHVVA